MVASFPRETKFYSNGYRFDNKNPPFPIVKIWREGVKGSRKRGLNRGTKPSVFSNHQKLKRL